MTPTPEHIELAGARARIRELEAILMEWRIARWNHGDIHDAHASRYNNDACDVCAVELKFWALTTPIAIAAIAARPAADVTETPTDKESTDN